MSTHSSASFAELYRDRYGQTVRLAWLLTRSSEAEDLAQDAFVEVERRFAGLETPEAYLRTAVVNRCRRWHRRRMMGADRVRRLRSQPDGLAGLGETAAAPAEPGDDALIGLLGQLPYRQRAAIVMRYWAGWSEAEIAEALGCRPGTVKSLASRGLTTLRAGLDGQARSREEAP